MQPLTISIACLIVLAAVAGSAWSDETSGTLESVNSVPVGRPIYVSMVRRQLLRHYPTLGLAGNPGCATDIVAAYNVRPLFSNASNIIDAYDEGCLSPFPNPVYPWNNSILHRIGVLYDKRYGFIYCTATLIDAHLIVTARHCLFRPATSFSPTDARREPTEPQSTDNLLFLPLNSAWRNASVKSFSTAITGNRNPGNQMQSKDVALIELQTDYLNDPSELAIATAPAAPPSRIVIPGFFAAAAYGVSGRVGLTPGRVDPPARWREFIRFDSADTCRVFAVANGCYRYTCQSDDGMSGSPIIALASGTGQTTLVGVHSGAALDSSDCDFLSGDDAAAAPNAGVFFSGP